MDTTPRKPRPCTTCKYSTWMSNFGWACYYIVRKQRRRPRPGGIGCTEYVYQKKNTKNKN